MSDEQVSYVLRTLDPKCDKGKLKTRKAKGGSWKITCRDRKIMAKNSNKQIGVNRTLSFYEGSATKKENWTDYKMHEYHEYPRKYNSSFQLESQLLPKQHVSPIIGDHVAKATMSQLESQLLRLPNFHWSSTMEDHLRNNSFSEMEEPQLLPNQHVSSNFEDYVAKSTFFEIASQLLANHQLSSDIENNAAKSFPSKVRLLVPAQQDELVDFNGLDHNCFSTLQSPLYPIPESFYSSSFDLDSFSTLQLPSHPQPGSSYSSGFSNDSTNGINYNCFFTLQFPIHPLPAHSYSNSFGNDSTNGLEHNSVSALQTPMYPQPGSSYFSDSSNDLNTMTPQFAAVLEDNLANSHWSILDDSPSPETGHVFLDFNSLKAVVGGYVGGGGSDSVIETFFAWPNEHVLMAGGEIRF